MNKSFIIYAHIAPNGKLYIGQTCQTLSDRSRNGKGYKDSPLFYKAIKKYGWDNFQHIVLIENLDVEQANVFEELIIKKYKTNDRRFGYNIAKGGLNTLHNQETILKIRKANQGKIISEESKRKMSIAHKGKYVENIRNRKRPVCQYTMDGVLVRKYKSIKEASEIIGVSDSNIINVCNHKNFSAKNFIWSYEGENPKTVLTKKERVYKDGYHPSSKRIIQYKNNIKIQEYSSAFVASQQTGIDSSCITKVCKRKRKTAGGYIWRYANEDNEDKKLQGDEYK